MDPSHLDQDQRMQAYSCSFKARTGAVTTECAYRTLGLRCGGCMSCLNNRMLNSEYGCLMFPVLMQVTALFILCVVLKRSFAFFSRSGLGYRSVWKINTDEFSIHWITPPILFCASVPFPFVSLFLLSNIPKPHSPTLGV